MEEKCTLSLFLFGDLEETIMRTIVVGDIHGCFREFQELLAKVHFSEEEDQLILLGDLMDRGPDSYPVLRRVMELREKMGDRLIFVRGNHEDIFLRAVFWGDDRSWKRNGYEATVRSFEEHGERYRDYADWIEENSVLFWKGEEIQCVHGGMTVPELEKNTAHDLIWNRTAIRENFYSGRLTIIGHTNMEKPMYGDGNGGELIPISCQKWQPLPKTGLIDLDSACVYGRSLTAMIVENGRFMLEEVTSYQEKSEM